MGVPYGIAARRCYGFTTNDERITIGDVMAEPLWINGKSFTAYGLVRRGFHVGSPLKRFDHSPFEYNSRLFTRHEPWLFLGLRCGYAATDSN